MGDLVAKTVRDHLLLSQFLKGDNLIGLILLKHIKGLKDCNPLQLNKLKDDL
jgi:hypothetical protein